MALPIVNNYFLVIFGTRRFHFMVAQCNKSIHIVHIYFISLTTNKQIKERRKEKKRKIQQIIYKVHFLSQSRHAIVIWTRYFSKVSVVCQSHHSNCVHGNWSRLSQQNPATPAVLWNASAVYIRMDRFLLFVLRSVCVLVHASFFGSCWKSLGVNPHTCSAL